jgi:alkaline phosphatase D
MSRCICFALLALLPAGLLGADDSSPVSKVAFGSCSKQDKPMPIWKPIAATKPELFLHLGDIVYADTDDMAKMKATYDLLGKDEGFQLLRQTCPFLGVWDDHDYGKNDAGVEYPKKDESQQILLDFLGVAKDSPRRTQKGVYHSEIYGPVGKRLQVILLDGRYFRSPLKRGAYDPVWRYTPYVPVTDPQATMLGAEQWKWLEEQLKKPAELRLLGTGIQVVSEDHPFEKWANLPLEREKLLKLIKDTKAEGVVVLSGDRHLAELSMLPPTEANGPGYPLYDVTSSGLNQADKNWRAPEKNRHRVSSMSYGDNFGVVQVDWTLEDPKVSLQLRDVDGDIIVQQKFPLSVLKSASHVATGKGKAEPLKLSEGSISAQDALGKVGEKVTVEMRVVTIGGTTLTRVYLNSERDFRSKTNLAVVLSPKVFVGKYEKANGETFKNKVVRVKGTVSLYKNETTQIMIDDAAAVEILEAK